MTYTAAVITVSDQCSKGLREDTSGPNLCDILQEKGYCVVYRAVVPDETQDIQQALLHCTDTLGVHLVLTTGGTGFSPRDITPEATMALVERPTPGIPEAMRAASMAITPKACLSRAAAGIRKKSLLLNLPGSRKASQENLLAVLDPIAHGLEMLLSQGSANCGG